MVVGQRMARPLYVTDTRKIDNGVARGTRLAEVALCWRWMGQVGKRCSLASASRCSGNPWRFVSDFEKGTPRRPWQCPTPGWRICWVYCLTAEKRVPMTNVVLDFRAADGSQRLSRKVPYIKVAISFTRISSICSCYRLAKIPYTSHKHT